MRRDVSDGEFSLPVRVYIEDTDAGGIVYYVNYLKFMERARTEYLRELGSGWDTLLPGGLMFVVRDAALTWYAPARLDDLLSVTAAPHRASGATVALTQLVRRGAELLVAGEITIACVDGGTLRPRRIPRDMLATLRGVIAGE
ncbi:tol-pal system-associated acyl-CoA thioesterase [Pseudohaliea rubra]|uniref:4-hydroxybenzoyl-CoA thioesterase family active site protein n=1 Tax=Pseudohaliea rubra DSM 19751 TaxID=1265313 RepID=A0A095WVD9_9GAMM|nr:tol-pal system-associated acyl-CoA thioesterase [Pseudohaliea rubra]KGE02589.1 4-hydroxybenzoyl-CoA thioesterase family active site protein [Pseudohaliea rubra DSM 19751]